MGFIQVHERVDVGIDPYDADMRLVRNRRAADCRPYNRAPTLQASL